MIVAMYICILIECFIVPLFIKWGWPELTKKSLYIKTVCSSLFIVFGYLACKECEKLGACAISDYQVKVLAGLCLGFIGDILLTLEPFFKNHKTANGVASILGGVSFLAGHILYIIAFFSRLEISGSLNLTLFITVFAVVLAIVIAIKFILKVKLGKLGIPVLIYAIMIDLMFTSALSLGIATHNPVLITLLGGGAFLFIVSDLNLALKIFDGDRFHTLPNRCTYIITYYLAQFMIAATMLFL